MSALVRLRLGRLVGLALVIAGLLPGRSEWHSALARWYYVGLMLTASGVGVAALWGSWRAWRRPEVGSDRPRFPTACCDLGLLLWGAALFLSALDDRANVARVFELDFFASVTPVATLLQWGALVAFFLAGAAHVFPRIRERWVNPTLSAAAVGAGLLLGEGLTRAQAILAPATTWFPTYSGFMWVRRYVRLNHQGFRDEEHAVDRPAGTRRLLIIGDSFAFGVGIARTEDRFGEQLGARLAQATGERWETMNASRPDSHTLDEIAMLESVRQFRPDVVLLVYVFNDIDYLHPVTVRSALGVTLPIVLQRLYPARLLFMNSFLFQQTYVRLGYVSSGRQAQTRAADAYSDDAAVDVHLSDLSRFVTEAESTGAVVGIVPFDPTVAVESSSRERDARFTARALASGLPVWRVDQAFAGLKLAQLRVNALDGHPNELANRLAADAVLPQVVRALRTGLDR